MEKATARSTGAGKPVRISRAGTARVAASVEVGSFKAGFTSPGTTKLAKYIAEHGKSASRRPQISTRVIYVYLASEQERDQLAREGVHATILENLAREMQITKETLFEVLQLPRSSVDRKIRNGEPLSTEQSERVLGLEKLIGQVEAMVAGSGDPTGFNASKWMGDWLQRPLPALNGARPAEYMITGDGRTLISKLLARSQSGAYS